MTLHVKGLKLKVEYFLGAFMLLQGETILAQGETLGRAVENLKA